MSSVISRVTWRRSSRVSGVRSSASCSVTTRSTFSARSSLDDSSSALPDAYSCGPSFAMHAWWIRPFSSPYGSAARRSGASDCPPRSTSSSGPWPFVEPLRWSLSWRPIALRPCEGRHELALLLRYCLRRHELLGHRADGLGELALRLGDDRGIAAVDRERDDAVARHLEVDLPLE